MAAITRSSAKFISEDIRVALETVAKKHGLILAFKGCRFNDVVVKPKVEFQVPASNPDVVEGRGRDYSAGMVLSAKDAAAWNVNAPLHGLPKEWLGKNTKNNYVITGWNTRCHKYPVTLVSSLTGRKLKATPRWVKINMETK